MEFNEKEKTRSRENSHLFWLTGFMAENLIECYLSTEADQHAHLWQSAVRKSRGLERLNSLPYMRYINTVSKFLFTAMIVYFFRASGRICLLLVRIDICIVCLYF